MPNYKVMYTALFQAMTQATEILENAAIAQAVEVMKKAQRETEEMYMSAADTDAEETGDTNKGNG